MKHWMRRRNRKPLFVSMVFMNSLVDLSWVGRFTMKPMEGIKGYDFSMAQPNLSQSRQVLICVIGWIKTF
jgi:hypothetical protein